MAHSIPLSVGQNIELHPATDYWMRGARFGQIRELDGNRVRVKLDKVHKLLWFRAEDILHMSGSECTCRNP